MNNTPDTFSSCCQWILEEELNLVAFEPLLVLGLQAVDYWIEQFESSCGMRSIHGELHQTKRLQLHELQFQFLRQKEGQHMTRLQLSSYGDPWQSKKSSNGGFTISSGGDKLNRKTSESIVNFMLLGRNSLVVIMVLAKYYLLSLDGLSTRFPEGSLNVSPSSFKFRSVVN